MEERRVLVIELDAEEAEQLPEGAVVWGELDPTEAALWVIDRDLSAAA